MVAKGAPLMTSIFGDTIRLGKPQGVERRKKDVDGSTQFELPYFWGMPPLTSYDLGHLESTRVPGFDP